MYQGDFDSEEVPPMPASLRRRRGRFLVIYCIDRNQIDEDHNLPAQIIDARQTSLVCGVIGDV